MSDPDKRWSVQLHRDAQRTLRRLPRNLLWQIDEVLQSLEKNLRPASCKRLTGPLKHLYRIRVREWRIVYMIEDDRLIVLVIEIAPRGGAYRSRR